MIRPLSYVYVAFNSIRIVRAIANVRQILETSGVRDGKPRLAIAAPSGRRARAPSRQDAITRNSRAP
jgi:hypothetical protein